MNNSQVLELLESLGVQLSKEQIDRKKQCMEELSNFNGFIEEIFIPELKKFVNI
ncbi:hypothetical protein TEPIDINF_002768 [Tepidibacillus infernus]|uniref:hypothetical protein n=1 Tax=Tepidibacillus infernus TaxID=1806172 RepID=UPI003A40F779